MTTTATPRARPSVPTSTSARPSASSITTAPRQTFDLPPYQSLLFPLNPTAVRAIQNIPRIHDLTRLNERLATSSQVLSNTAAEINDRYQHRRAQLEREKARAREKDVAVENVDERQERLEIMKCEVEDMTEKMEQGVRGVIDARAEVEVSERVTGELGGRAGEGGSLQTQSTLGASQSQFRRAKRRIVTDDERDEEEDEDGETGARGSGEGVVGIWKKKIGDEGRVYEGLSMMARYSSHNDYIGFKRLLHDAKHPGPDAPPLPHPSTWFPGSVSPESSQNNASARKGVNANNDHDESDVEVASERISIKCPLTLLPMKEPYSSRKCPHSFEKEAILGMIEMSGTFVGPGGRRAGNEKAMKCPVCAMLLTPSDLYPDPILLRKIARINAAHTREDLDDDDDDRSHSAVTPGGSQLPRAQEVDSDDNDSGLNGRRRRIRSIAPRIKAERLSTASIPGSVVPDTQMPPLLDEDEDDYEEEEDGEEV